MACHVGVEAGIVLLASAHLIVDGEFRRGSLIIAEHQVITDAFVFIAAIIQMREGSFPEFSTVLRQGLCVVVAGEMRLPLCAKLRETLRQVGDKLLIQEAKIEEDVVADQRLLGL